MGRAELRQSFDAFPRLAVAKELEENPAVETFLESPTWTELERATRIEETLAEIEAQLEQLPLGLDVLDVIGGEEIAVAADFEGQGVDATDWAVYARVLLGEARRLRAEASRCSGSRTRASRPRATVT